MASPVDTFKTSLFGQLKSYGDAVQGVFEQRIARPLLAFKRDLSRAPSTGRTSSDREPVSPSHETSFITHQESIASSSPLEIIDMETNGSFKTMFDKVKNTFSPLTKRRTSEDSLIDDTEKPIREHRHSSISSLSNKNHRRNQLRHYKSVSFAENIQYDKISPTNNNQYSINDRKELIHNAHALADQIIMSSIDEATINSSSVEENENDFENNFPQGIRTRRISIGNSKDLVYQDLSAEIVAYVLKHALKVLEKEDEALLLTDNQNIIQKNEQNEDFIDLK